MSMSYSSVYGNKIRKLWKLLAKNDMLTSTAYDFSDPQKCKVKDCDFKVWYLEFLPIFSNVFFSVKYSHGNIPPYQRKSLDRNKETEYQNWETSWTSKNESIP